MLKNFSIIRTLGKYCATILIVNAFFVISGEGSFGTVYLVKRLSDGRFYALKKVSFVNSDHNRKKLQQNWS